MKKSSIKWKVTLIYTMIVTVLLLVIALVGFYILKNIEISKTEEELQGSIVGFQNEIHFSDNSYYLDADADFYDDGVMFCVYDQDGRLLSGSMPVDFPSNTTLVSKKMRRIEQENKAWMIYDEVYTYGNEKAVWIRGITSIHQTEDLMKYLLYGVLLAFPFLVLLIGFFSYHMIGHALKPVTWIQQSAEQISDGKDLSKRLSIPKTKDELYELTLTFNAMFERLENAFENEKQFTSDVSHELRTPVAVMISQCEYMLEDEQLSKEMREEIQVILNKAKSMASMISQMLMIAKSESRKDQFQFEPVNLSMLAQIIGEELTQQGNEKGIQIVIEAQDCVMIQGEETLLMRMLMNLMENAITYGKENGYVKTRVYSSLGQAVLCVEDNGIGIGTEHIDKIWNRFYQVDKSNHKVGSGLGLSMVRWIANIHEANLSVESKEGVGTTFTVVFPME